MSDPVPRARLEEALAALGHGPGVPCAKAQADGFPCPELGFDCTDCDYGREVLLAWIAEHYPPPAKDEVTVGSDW
jgi:hypothetical protein